MDAQFLDLPVAIAYSPEDLSHPLCYDELQAARAKYQSSKEDATRLLNDPPTPSILDPPPNSSGVASTSSPRMDAATAAWREQIEMSKAMNFEIIRAKERERSPGLVSAAKREFYTSKLPLGRAPTPEEKRQHELVEEIQRQEAYLRQLKLEEERLTPRLIDLQEKIREVVEEASPPFSHREVTLENENAKLQVELQESRSQSSTIIMAALAIGIGFGLGFSRSKGTIS